MCTKKTITFDYIRGFLDSDGGFTARVTRKQNNQVGFSLLISFCQRTASVDSLEVLKDYLQSDNRIVFTNHNNRKKSRFDVFFNSKPGELLMEQLTANPPLAPGKLRDFLITKKVHDFVQSGLLIDKPSSDALKTSSDYKKIYQATCVMLIAKSMTNHAFYKREQHSKNLNI